MINTWLIYNFDGKVHYYLPDYQGNIVADVTAAGKVVQKASYYPYGEPWLEPEGDNRRLYGGKERLNFGALRHSDFGARLLDTRSGRWNSQDPCAEEFYPLSPYSVCLGDPINFVDTDGCRPSVIEAIMMAKYSYPDSQNSENDILSFLGQTGWYLSVLNSAYSTTISNFADLEATIFVKNTGNGEREYACAFAGTHDMEGWLSNVTQLFGKSQEYKDCVEFSKNLSNEISKEELTFIGHSQGGGKAAAASMVTNRAAITFNPAAISEQTKKNLNLGKANNIVNYIICGYLVDKGFRVGGDPVHNFQKNFLRLTPPGRIEYIYPTFFLRHGIDNF